MDIFDIFMLLGGLGMFIYGMKIMSDGLEAAAGSKMRHWLEILTKNRFAGIAVGAGVTVAVQSSSATTVMAVGFVNAGLMTLSQAVSVCMGANIGTTFTAQLIAFNLSDIAPLLLFLGVVGVMFFKNKTWQKIAQIVAGFGILFLGMSLMSNATAGLKDYQPFINIISTFSNPLIGILVGAIFTAIIQASGATMAILLALASTGTITLASSMYVILGLNIGTCITAVLASLGTNKTGRRTAVVHVLFNVFGTLIFLVLLNVFPIQRWIEAVSPGDIERQLANFHMIFNIVTTAVLVWFPGLLIKLATMIVRGEDKPVGQRSLKYLNKANVDNPAVAVGQVIREVGRMAELAMHSFEMALDAFSDKDTEKIAQVKEQEQTVNYLEENITKFLVDMSREELSKEDSMTVAALLHMTMDIERISDHAENVVEFAEYEIEHNLVLSEEAKTEITAMMNRVRDALESAVSSFVEGDLDAAHEVIDIEQEVDEMEIRLKDNHVNRLAAGICGPMGAMVYTDLVTNLERVADHSTNIAYHVIDNGLYKH